MFSTTRALLRYAVRAPSRTTTVRCADFMLNDPSTTTLQGKPFNRNCRFSSLDGGVRVQNNNLNDLDSDFLYHLGFSSSQDLEGIFGDVKFFCCGGAASRMEIFANQVANELSEEFEEYRKPYGLKPSVIAS